MLLLPGFAESMHCWRAQMAALAAAGYAKASTADLSRWSDMVHICRALDELSVPDRSQSLEPALEIVNGSYRKNSFESVYSG